jgi:hypothetical protein
MRQASPVMSIEWMWLSGVIPIFNSICARPRVAVAPGTLSLSGTPPARNTGGDGRAVSGLN